MNKIQRTVMRMLGVQSVVEDFRATPESMANQMDAGRITSALAAAEQGFVGELWNLYDSIIAGDVWIQAMLAQRKLAILNDAINAEPEDPDRPEDAAAAAEVAAAMRGLRRFRMGTLSHLLDGVLRPLAVSEMVFRADAARPGKFRLDRIVDVPHFCEDYSKGRLEIFKQDAGNAGRTGTETYEVEVGRHIVHRGHILTAPDNWGGPMRPLVFLWLLRTCNREWWARSLERWGSAIPIGKYPSGDKSAKAALQAAFGRFHRLGGMVVSDNSTVELIAGAAAGDGTAWEKLQNWAERQITISILGQELSSGAQATGLGSGVADLQGRVRDDLSLMDEMALGETLTNDFALAVTQANGLPGRCKVVVGTGTNLAKASGLATILANLSTAGIEAEDGSLDTLGKMMGLGLRRASRPAGAPYGFPGGLPLSQLVRAELARELKKGGV